MSVATAPVALCARRSINLIPSSLGNDTLAKPVTRYWPAGSGIDTGQTKEIEPDSPSLNFTPPAVVMYLAVSAVVPVGTHAMAALDHTAPCAKSEDAPSTRVMTASEPVLTRRISIFILPP